MVSAAEVRSVEAVVHEPRDITELALPLLEGFFVTSVLARPVSKGRAAVRAGAIIADVTLVECEFAQGGMRGLAKADNTAKAREAPALSSSPDAVEDRLCHHARLNLVVVRCLRGLCHVLDLSCREHAQVERLCDGLGCERGRFGRGGCSLAQRAARRIGVDLHGGGGCACGCG